MDALEPSRWHVVWWAEGIRHERYCDDRALAEAYAAAHHGQVVPMAALVPWPRKPGSEDGSERNGNA